MNEEIAILTDLLFIARNELTRFQQKHKEVVKRMDADYNSVMEQAQKKHEEDYELLEQKNAEIAALKSK